MLPRGRPPGPGTAEEKAAIRRERVRLNVKAYRERKKNASVDPPTTLRSSSYSQPSPTDSNVSTTGSNGSASLDDQQEYEDKERQIVVRSNTQVVSKPRNPGFDGVQQPPEVTSLWLTPDSGSVFSDAFLAVFRSTFLPINVQLPSEDGGMSLLVTPCSPWITNAYNLARKQDSSALKSGLLAIGLVLTGLQNSSNELKVASFQMHRQAICRLRNDLVPITLQIQHKRSAASIFGPYLSCLAVTMFELVQSGFSSAILQHLKALNSLIEMMCADPNIDHLTAALMMEDFGMLEMIFCLKYGFGSILGKTRRKIEWRQREKGVVGEYRSNASVYGDMLDVMDELPSLMVRVEALKALPSSESLFKELQQVHRKLLKIQGDLDAWNIQFEVCHGSIMMQEGFPFDTVSQSELRPRLRSYEHGGVALFLLNFQLCALDANIEAITILTRMQRRQSRQMEAAQQETISTSSTKSWFNAPLALDLTQADKDAVSHTSANNEEGFLYEQLKAQRAKARSTTVQLLKVMDQFSKIANSLSGQTLLVSPCERVRAMLSKEQIRLEEDLRCLYPWDHDGAAEVNRYQEDTAVTSNMFRQLKSTLQQHEFGAIHDG